METKQKTLLAVILIARGGSTYFSSSDKSKDEMASIVVRRCVRDWKSMYKIPRGEVWNVHFYDITGFESWNLDYSGNVTSESNKRAEHIETMKVLY